MPDKETVMLDTEMAELRIAGDLGLDEPDTDRIAAVVSAALDREFAIANGGGAVPRIAGRWRRYKRYVFATFVALVVGGIATAGYAALTASNTASEGIGCYAGGKSDGGATIVGLDGRRATATCADLWSSGEVVAGADRPPAPLHACVAGDGGGPIQVFATNDAFVCNKAGLVDDPNAGLDRDARRFGEFSSQISAILERPENSCVDQGRMRSLVERLLGQHGMTGWTIAETGATDRAGACATLAFDSDARTITMFSERP